jgi:hypothetical protein
VAATPRPTTRPAIGGPSRAPAQTVERFYELVAQHRFDAAAALWSPRMRAQYPPAQYIDGRFAPTTAIDILHLATTAESTADGTARVAVDLIEHRDDGTSRHWLGSWDLVLADGGWLMDRPRF